jgi:predicted Co/Zn/Cd cation transporter (cation efflux family)
VLVYAVIAAVGSDGGAKVGVAIAYIVGAILLLVGAAALWRRPGAPAGPAV